MSIITKLRNNYSEKKSQIDKIYQEEYEFLHNKSLTDCSVTIKDFDILHNRFINAQRENVLTIIDYYERIQNGFILNGFKETYKILFNEFNEFFIEIATDLKNYTVESHENQLKAAVILASMKNQPVVEDTKPPEPVITNKDINQIVNTLIKVKPEQGRYSFRKRCDICKKVCKEH